MKLPSLVLQKYPKNQVTIRLISLLRRFSDQVNHMVAKYEAETLLNSLAVLNGPFKGLKYPNFESHCSSVYPKLLGSYEAELQPVIKQLLPKRYKLVVDIGAAEGYYAAGFAKYGNSGKVIVYEADDKARSLCSEILKLNAVADKVEVHGTCSKEDILQLDLNNSLIISDCEGFEKQIFDAETVKHLTKTDIVIEVHDFVHRDLTPSLYKIFEQTHHIKLIQSTTDESRAINYQLSELKGLSFRTRKFILSEYRPEIMNWMVCTPKTDVEPLD